MQSWGTVKRVYPYLRRYWVNALLALALVAVCSLLGLLTPWPLKILIDSVLQDHPLPGPLAGLGELANRPVALLTVTVAGGFLLSIVQNSAELLNKYAQTRLEQKLLLDFRSDLFQHAQRLSLAYHTGRRSGELLSRITVRAGALGKIGLAVLPITQSGVTLVGMFLVAYALNAQLALLSLVVVPFVYYSIGYYARRIEPRVRQVREMEGESLSLAHEALAMLKVIQAFGRESYEHARFRRHNEEALQERIRLTFRQIAYSWLVNLMAALGIALVLGVGAYRVLQGDLTVGLLLVIVTYVGSVYTPLQMISGTVAGLQEQLVDLRLSLDVLDTEPEVRDLPAAVSIRSCRGAVLFDSVHFNYPGRRQTLREVCFDAPAGQVVGVVGPTGAGKTTLVSLIPRFLDPDRGRVLIDGFDVRRLTLQSLRRQVSVVLQEPLLTSGTIADNIRYGKLTARLEEIERAARAAHAHDFICALPDGYETQLGERGARLSGGEQQRVAIARAFLKDAPILILDEPTSAVDSNTESLILKALEDLVEGRTTFIVAHRLSAISRADAILVLDEGRIVESGGRDDLLRRGGLFKKLVDTQSAEVVRGI